MKQRPSVMHVKTGPEAHLPPARNIHAQLAESLSCPYWSTQPPTHTSTCQQYWLVVVIFDIEGRTSSSQTRSLMTKVWNKLNFNTAHLRWSPNRDSNWSLGESRRHSQEPIIGLNVTDFRPVCAMLERRVCPQASSSCSRLPSHSHLP